MATVSGLAGAQYAHDHAYSSDSPRSEREAARAYDQAWDNANRAAFWLREHLEEIAERDTDYCGISLSSVVKCEPHTEGVKGKLDLTLHLNGIDADDVPHTCRLQLADALRELASDIERV